METTELLDANPRMGTAYRSRNPLLAGIRYQTVTRFRQFVLVYRPTAEGVEILHVLRGHRDLAAILDAGD